jgi:hypothetical protein
MALLVRLKVPAGRKIRQRIWPAQREREKADIFLIRMADDFFVPPSF